MDSQQRSVVNPTEVAHQRRETSLDVHIERATTTAQ